MATADETRKEPTSVFDMARALARVVPGAHPRDCREIQALAGGDQVAATGDRHLGALFGEAQAASPTQRNSSGAALRVLERILELVEL